MKNIQRIVFYVLLIKASNVSGQVSDTLAKHKTFQLPSSEFSVSVSFRFPVGSFGKAFVPEGTILESMEGKTGGMEAEMGYEFGLTGNYFFDRKPSNFNTGLRITYLSFSTIPFKWNTSNDYIFKEGDFTNLEFLSAKAGIVFRKAIGDRKSFQFYNQVCFSYGWNGGMKYESTVPINQYSNASDQAELAMHSGTGVTDEMGLAFTTGHFIFDVGYSFGKIKFKNVEYTRDLSAPGYNPINIDLAIEPKVPVNTTHLTIGFEF
jgi:hypothetical protein